METVTVAEARRRLAEVVAKVGPGGKRVLLERHGKPVAAMISVEDLKKLENMEKQQDQRDEERRRQALIASEAANRAREMMLKERNGEYLPDSAELIREMREERVDEILGLR
jgi:prevent-host-death family protein